MRSQFHNINQVPTDDLYSIKKWTFTYTVPPNTSVMYKTNKGAEKRRYFRTLSHKIQCFFLKNDIEQLNNVAYFFEQHKDGRFHLHGFCIDTAHNMLNWMKGRFNEIRCKAQDIQEKLLLCEEVSHPPAWVNYVQKEAKDKLLFKYDIDAFINKKSFLTIEHNIPDENILNIDYLTDEYKFTGKKKYIVEI